MVTIAYVIFLISYIHYLIKMFFYPVYIVIFWRSLKTELLISFSLLVKKKYFYYSMIFKLIFTFGLGHFSLSPHVI